MAGIGLADVLTDDDGLTSLGELALEDCLQLRTDAKKPLSSVEELLKNIVVPAAALAEDRGELKDALEMMELANELEDDTFDEDDVKALKKRVKKLGKARQDGD